MIREANKNDLDEILQLYLYLHEKSIPEDSEHLRSTWDNIMNDAIIILLFVRLMARSWHPVYV